LNGKVTGKLIFAEFRFKFAVLLNNSWISDRISVRSRVVISSKVSRIKFMIIYWIAYSKINENVITIIFFKNLTWFTLLTSFTSSGG
jgi:hypothetical protein